MSERKKFVVYRDKWIRGSRLDSFLLRQSDQRMCCVGFLAKQSLGLNDDSIMGSAALCGVPAYATYSDLDNRIFAAEIYSINDDETITDRRRETLLKKQFARIGFKVEFRDSEPSA